MTFTDLKFGTCSSQCDQCTHLDIYDGDSKSSPSLGRFCPESAKETKVSHGNKVFVEFESGFGNDRGTGFEVQYSETVMKSKGKQTEPPTSNHHFYLIFMLSHGPNKNTEAYKSTVVHYIFIYWFSKTLGLKIHIKYTGIYLLFSHHKGACLFHIKGTLPFVSHLRVAVHISIVLHQPLHGVFNIHDWKFFNIEFLTYVCF